MMRMVGPRRAGWITSFATFVVFLAAAAASAETLLMPKRDMLQGASEVVWGVSTQANGTAFTLDFGDGASVSGTLGVAGQERSYIRFNHAYALTGPYTVTLTVGAEVATVQVNVHSFPAGSFELRALNKNRAIQDGLRYLWFSQNNREGAFPGTFPGGTTQWPGSWPRTHAAIIALAFENHGYLLPNDNSAPTGVYEKYVVQRALNFVASQASLQALNVQTAGNPCVGAGIEPAPCTGLTNAFEHPGYSTAILALPFAGSNALSRVMTGVPAGNNGGYVNGRTYGEILQRLMNAIAWGQIDGAAPNGGGWHYGFSNNAGGASDGSTVGWDVLGLLDAEASGTTIATFVKPEFQNKALPGALNTDGSFDYNADNNPAVASPAFVGKNVAKSGIGLQGLFYTGTVGVGNPQVAAGRDFISARWNAQQAGDNYGCFPNGTHNKGCGYAMFNVFKAFKLHGIVTIPGSTRPAGPGPIPANDWHAEYEDYLVATQTAPTTTTGGQWNGMAWSCCDNSSAAANAALAELILAPVALIQPDPSLFATVGLSPATAQNAVGTNHTVTATAQSSGGAPVPGATVNFQVNSGPNAGKTGVAVTNAAGQATFTYTGTGGAGTDKIQAFIGSLGSNIVDKIWLLKCDADVDNDIDSADLLIIRNANGQTANSSLDPRDGNSDGNINIADARYCQLRCTRPSCAQ
jgi:hypothetical protein